MNDTNCTQCFDRPNDTCAMPVWVPNGDGTYTKHRQRSVYHNHDDRDCPWQEADHKARIERLRSGDYRK